MIKKVKEYLSICTWDDIFDICTWKIPIIVFVAVILIVSCKITIEKRWGEIFTYHEEEYQALEVEANLMVENQTFDTDYECIIKNLNNRSDDVSFELWGNNVWINVEVINYKKDAPEIKIERSFKNKCTHILGLMAILFILIPFVSAVCVAIVLGILWLIIGGILLLFEFIMNKIEK